MCVHEGIICTQTIEFQWNYWQWCLITTMERDEEEKRRKIVCNVLHQYYLTDVRGEAEGVSKKILGMKLKHFIKLNQFSNSGF